jgi:hypothetical protein
MANGRSDRFRILAAAIRAGVFTASDLVGITSATEASIRKVIERDLKSDEPVFEEYGTQVRPRGKPRTQYTIRTKMIPRLRSELRHLRQELDAAELGAERRPTAVLGAVDGNLIDPIFESPPLVAAENAVMRELSNCDNGEGKRLIVKRAISYRGTDNKLFGKSQVLDPIRVVADWLIHFSIKELAFEEVDTNGLGDTTALFSPSILQMARAASIRPRKRIVELLKRVTKSPLLRSALGDLENPLNRERLALVAGHLLAPATEDRDQKRVLVGNHTTSEHVEFSNILEFHGLLEEAEREVETEETRPVETEEVRLQEFEHA